MESVKYNAPTEPPSEVWYARECDFHEKIVALYNLLDMAKLYLRSIQAVDPAVPRPSFSAVQPGSNRDSVVCALASKAVNTKSAIKLLCDANHGDDALVLGRTILELAVTLDWLLAGPPARLDTYCLFTTANKRRWMDLIVKYGDASQADEARAAMAADPFGMALSAEVFGDQYLAWAWFPSETLPTGPERTKRKVNGRTLELVRFPEMLAEVGGHGGLREVFYFEASQYVHSAPPSLLSFNLQMQRAQYFTMQLGPQPQQRAKALWVSNIAMLTVLGDIDQYTGGHLERPRQEVLDAYNASTYELAQGFGPVGESG